MSRQLPDPSNDLIVTQTLPRRIVKRMAGERHSRLVQIFGLRLAARPKDLDVDLAP
jgi:hypothetical protein